MSELIQTVAGSNSAPFAGAQVVARIRHLLIAAGLAALVYTMLMASSKGYCAGGIRADGTFIDSAGNIVATAPPCIQLTLRPSLLIYLAIAVIVVGSLTIVLRRARSQADALNYLNRGAIVIGILVIASIIIAQTWFLAIPITEWDGSSAFLYPFPFGAIDVVRTSMVP